MPPYSILFLQSRSELFRRIFKAKWMQSSSPSLRTCVDECNLRAWKLLWPSQCVSSFVLLRKYLYPMCAHFFLTWVQKTHILYIVSLALVDQKVYKLFWEAPMKGRDFRFAQRSRLPTLAKLMWVWPGRLWSRWTRALGQWGRAHLLHRSLKLCTDTLPCEP